VNRGLAIKFKVIGQIGAQFCVVGNPAQQTQAKIACGIRVGWWDLAQAHEGTQKAKFPALTLSLAVF
jgi:hypothetical protein